MIKGSRVLIIKKNQILLVHRIKDNKEYYVLPGGSIEDDETPKEAALREAKEETNLDVEIKELLWKFEEEYNKNYGYYFLVKNFKGNLKLGGPEAEKQSDKNQYILTWMPLSKIAKIKLCPEKLKKLILIKFL